MKIVVVDTNLTWSTMSIPTSSTSSSSAVNGIPVTAPSSTFQIPSRRAQGLSTTSSSSTMPSTASSSNGISVITKNDQQPQQQQQPEYVYKLVYFTSRGYAEVSRLILHYCQIPFQDMRLNTNEWAYFKSQMPYGKLPLLIFEENQELNDSKEIAKFLAKRHGLAGKTTLEEIKVDSIIDLRMKFGTEVQSYIALSVSTHPSLDLRSIREKTFNESFLPAINKFSPMLIELLAKTKTSKFFMESGVTVADFYVAELSDTLGNFYSDFEKKFPQLVQHSKDVHSLPQLEKYLKERSFSKY
uniref:Glutathione S-transferase n=1 Tax=Panagrolaimus sp. ES5 TaxID=591445 RepID=A0AC34FV88_9BILA